MNIHYIDGSFVPEDDATISVNDLSVLRGYGVFDFLRTYSGKPFHFTDHLLRFKRSAALLNLRFESSIDELKELIYSTLSKNNLPEYNIKMILTGGISSDGITPDNPPQLLILVKAPTKIPASCYTEGVKIVSSHFTRIITGAKTINYIPAILGLKEARNQNAIESIYTDKDGFLLEGTTSNFFAVIDDQLITPPETFILPGITRKVILELINDEIPLVIRNIHKDEIPLMNEAFITASNKEIMPVTSFNSYELPASVKPGITRKVMDLFSRYTSGYGK